MYGYTTKSSALRSAALAALLCSLTWLTGAELASAGERLVGPCIMRLDDPHESSTEPNRIKVNVYYRCTADVYYITAHLTLWYCNSYNCDPMVSGSVVDQQSRTATTTGGTVNRTSQMRLFVFALSDLNPNSGWYVATARYVVCEIGQNQMESVDKSRYFYWTQDGGGGQIVDNPTHIRVAPPENPI